MSIDVKDNDFYRTFEPPFFDVNYLCKEFINACGGRSDTVLVSFAAKNPKTKGWRRVKIEFKEYCFRHPVYVSGEEVAEADKHQVDILKKWGLGTNFWIKVVNV